MPFRRSRRSTRASRRPHRRHPRRPVRKFSRRSRNKPTTMKAKSLMPDRTFVKFSFTTLTAGSSYDPTVSGPTANGQGFIPWVSDDLQQYVFSPNWSTGGTPNLLVNLYAGLPGNGLNIGAIETDAYWSDGYEQICPTGVGQWSTFYIITCVMAPPLRLLYVIPLYLVN